MLFINVHVKSTEGAEHGGPLQQSQHALLEGEESSQNSGHKVIRVCEVSSSLSVQLDLEACITHTSGEVSEEDPVRIWVAISHGLGPQTE